MTLKINIIGAGRLGKTIGRLIRLNNLGTIVGVCNRSFQSAQEAVLFIGEGTVVDRIRDLPASDLTFITTPDDAIVGCRLELSCPTVVHCSGVLSSEVLRPSCNVASFHPLRSFADPSTSVQEFAGTLCAIEGDEQAKCTVRSLFDRLGATCFEVDPGKKSLYHAACVFASNYVVTLFDVSVKDLVRAGIERDVATRVALSLMEGTLRNLNATCSAQKSLTGPIARGDVETIERHLAALQGHSHKDLYASLAKSTYEVLAQ